MARRRQQDDIRLSVIGDLDGMTVGRLRELLEGISDDAVIVADGTEYHDDRDDSTDTFYHLVIRRD